MVRKITEVAGMIDRNERTGVDRILFVFVNSWETSRITLVLRPVLDAGIRTILAENVSSAKLPPVLGSSVQLRCSSRKLSLNWTSTLPVLVCRENRPFSVMYWGCKGLSFDDEAQP